MATWDDVKKADIKPPTSKKEIKEARQLRRENQKTYDNYNVEEGEGYRSRLEALWVSEFENCDSLVCVECVQVPVWITGPYGRFLGSYTPDLVIESGPNRDRTYVELKPNHKLAMADDRPVRALELNPGYKFIVIGGYSYSKRGVTCRLLTGDKELVRKNVPVKEVLRFLGCGEE